MARRNPLESDEEEAWGEIRRERGVEEASRGELSDAEKQRAVMWWMGAVVDAEGRERRRLENWRGVVEDLARDVLDTLEERRLQ